MLKVARTTWQETAFHDLDLGARPRKDYQKFPQSWSLIVPNVKFPSQIVFPFISCFAADFSGKRHNVFTELHLCYMSPLFLCCFQRVCLLSQSWLSVLCIVLHICGTIFYVVFTCSICLCSAVTLCNACTTSQLHLFSSMSVPTFPITAGSP